MDDCRSKVVSGTVYVVHCIDTEGPLHESTEATFERLREIFNIDLEPSAGLLRSLQEGTVDLGGLESAVRKVVDPQLLNYNDTWDKVDAMLADCMSRAFRMRIPDSAGGGWVYNWFCVDHVDYDVNPRRRDIGYHNVFDHYRTVIRESGSHQDGLHFHYHPHGFRREAHRCATHWWTSSDSLHQVLARRVIDRQWFPAVNRPGFHVTRPDSHWFLEQFIPFDYASQAIGYADAEDGAQAGVENGRLGDWRRAPVTWEPYHPAHDDYQVPGSCRRWIARCLNVGTRYRLLSERDVWQAFDEARQGKPVVLAVTNHDFRDMRPDVDGVRRLLTVVAKDFPDVPFRFAEAADAFRLAEGLAPQRPCELELTLSRVGDSHALEITSETPTFGPQPWFAMRTVSGTYHHDNLDMEVPFHRWRYVFDEETFPMAAVSAIGVAANNAFGVTTVASMDPSTGRSYRKHWNLASDDPPSPQ